MTREPLYVQVLNEAEAGPFTPIEATAHAKSAMFIAPAEIDAMIADHAAGGTGPWHFSYGFHSVTIREGSEVAETAARPAEA